MKLILTMPFLIIFFGIIVPIYLLVKGGEIG